jgi:hypothetical protein
VRIVGKVTTFLSSGTRTSNEDFSITNESSSLTMFKDFTNLLGDLAEDPVPLLPDNHVFPFSFRLPASSIPCSFEGTYGNVRYVLSATLICKGKPRRTVIQKELTVPSTMDSTDLDLIQPVQVKERGESGSFWWKSGYFDIQIDIPRGGYTSEEHVPIKITIFNHSNYGLWIKQICLKQKVTYTTVDRH